MRYLDYLKERFYQLLFVLGIVFTIEAFLLTVPNNIFIKWYVLFVIIGGYLLLTWFEYHRMKKFLSEADEMLTQLEKKYLLPEVLHFPDKQEYLFIMDIMKTMSKSMADYVNQFQLENREYKEYIEMWIHEVKIPIAAAKMIGENHKSEEMKNILFEIERIDGYVEQALYYARSNTVEKDYMIKRIRLEEIVNPVLIRNKNALIAKKTKVSLHGLEQEVYSDSKWLTFILNQIVVNSIKYSEKIPMELEITAEEKKEVIQLTIRDNGIGINKNELSRVFEKGFTGENGRVYKKSTGIGLYLCKKLCIKLSHGLSIDSEEEKGTCVTITFPKGSFLVRM